MNATEVALLGHLCEELGEAVQAAGQALRFGGLETPKIVSPNTGQVIETAKDRLEKELGDVLATICVLSQNGLLNVKNITQYRADKLIRLRLGTDNLGRPLVPKGDVCTCADWGMMDHLEYCPAKR